MPEAHRGDRRRIGVSPLLLVAVGCAHVFLFSLPNLSRALTAEQIGAGAFSILCAVALLLLLLRAASARVGWARWIARVSLPVLALLVAAQLYASHVFASYLDEAVLQSAGDLARSILAIASTQVRGAVLTFAPLILAAVALPAALAAVTPRDGEAPTATRPLGLAALVVIVVFAVFRVVPLNPGLSPELLLALSLPRAANHSRDEDGYLNRPHHRDPLSVPSISARPPRKRSVLVVLNESVRADESCIRYDPACTLTPAVNRAVPERIPLTRLRTLDSTTAISLGVLLTGLPVDAPKKKLHEMPLLFEYAQAAGWKTAYLTSQNLEFAGSGAWLESVSFTERASSSTFEARAPLEQGADDRLLLPYAARTLAALPEPFLALVQLSNTHFHYRIDEADAPYQPTSEVLSESTAAPLKNRYRDAIHAQDAELATFLTSFRASAAGRDTVILYLSDHGESFFERGYGYHATSLDEDEVHVPGWVDAPPGTLTDAEQAALRSRTDRPVTIADVAPTVLDLLGAGRDPALGRFQAEMPGSSWLRAATEPSAPVFLSNCTRLWTCAFLDYGALRGGLKYFVRVDKSYCFDTLADPAEQHDLGERVCADLVSFSQQRWARLEQTEEHR